MSLYVLPKHSLDVSRFDRSFCKDIFITLSLPLQKLYSLSMESGRSAAKYFINNNPKFFAKDFSEPHIPVRHAVIRIPSRCTVVQQETRSCDLHVT